MQHHRPFPKTPFHLSRFHTSTLCIVDDPQHAINTIITETEIPEVREKHSAGTIDQSIHHRVPQYTHRTYLIP